MGKSILNRHYCSVELDFEYDQGIIFFNHHFATGKH